MADDLRGTWIVGTSYPVERNSRFGCTGYNNKIYLIGGDRDSDCLYVYNIATDSWEKKADVPEKMRGCFCAAYDGKIHVFGETFTSGILNASDVHYIYDIPADKWSVGKKLPHARRYLCGGVNENYLYAMGGQIRDNSGVYKYDNTVLAYDFEADAWTIDGYVLENTNPNGPKFANHNVQSIFFLDSLETGGTLQIYDTITHSGSMGPSLPDSDWVGFSLTAMSDKVYSAGGDEGQGVIDRFQYYDTRREYWVIAEPLPTARVRPSLIAVSGKICAIAGSTNYYEFTNELDIYTPTDTVITVQCFDTDANELQPTLRYAPAMNKDFTNTAPAELEGLRCVGYTIDDGPLQPGLTATIPMAALEDDHTITFWYEPDDGQTRYTVTEHFQDETGAELASSKSYRVVAGGSHTASAPTLTGYTYLGHRLDGGTLQSGANATLNSIQSNHDIIFVYRKDEEQPGPGPAPNPNGCCGCAKVKLEITGCSCNKLIKQACELVSHSECDCTCTCKDH